MTDGTLNVGCTGLGWYTNSKGQKVRTTLWRHAQAGNWKGVCERLTDFVNSAGKRRRDWLTAGKTSKPGAYLIPH
jgi:lysozyme